MRFLGAAVDGNKEQSCCSGGKGVDIPSSAECPEASPDTVFIRVGKRRGIQHTWVAYPSMSNKATVIKTDTVYR